MHLKQAVMILGVVVAIVLCGAFTVWLFGYLGQFIPVTTPG